MILDPLQKTVDVISDALMRDDFDTCLSVIDLPLVLLSEGATSILATAEDARVGFDSTVAFLRSHGATDFMRLVLAASEYAPGLITGRYETQILRGGHRIFGPFSSSMSMRQVGGDWKITSIVTPIHGDRWPIEPIPFRIELRSVFEKEIDG